MSEPSIHPPLGGVVAANYLCGFGVEPDLCRRPAAWHVIWDSSMENGTACQEHLAFVRRYAYYALHPFDTTCAMPGAVFIEEENRCVMLEDISSSLLIEAAVEAQSLSGTWGTA